MARVVVGLTGPFGAGCTTAGHALRDDRGFTLLRLSVALRDRWQGARSADATRAELQRVGNELREAEGRGALVDYALARGAGDAELIVVDGIRNVGEVDRLREAFGYSFTLIAVNASRDARWERLRHGYTDRGLDESDFLSDDERDRSEGTIFGQQVSLCTDAADIIVDNGDYITLGDHKRKILEFADLITGNKPRHASRDEIHMHMAYSASHSSKCLKRHVGAILVDVHGEVIGTGYNENPEGTKPCVEEPLYGNACYRDIVRNRHFDELVTLGANCPHCGQMLDPVEGPPWLCARCQENGVRTNLETFFFPDRAMQWCTAIHAEVRALMASGHRARGSQLFTTTFPCFQCAEQIAQSGVKEIVFTEAYPEIDAADRLAMSGIGYRQFEGVRSSAFERLFSQVKPD